jgi:hypothetical protein
MAADPPNDKPKDKAKDKADAKDGNDGPTKVVVNEIVLTNQARIWRSWGDHITKKAGPLRGFAIAPGDFPPAHQLKKTALDNLEQLLANGLLLGDTLRAIADQLDGMAQQYRLVEDDNKDEAVRLRKLTDAVDVFLPGASNTVPQVPGLPPPPPPPAEVPIPEAAKQPNGGGQK